MSWSAATDPICTEPGACDPVDLVISPIEHDIGGLSVRRVLPTKEAPAVGPFVFFDQMGPATLAADSPLSVRPHPHIGLSTLTWMIEGSIMHRDSLGYAQEIVPGAVNWMTAGSGVVHSERTPERLRGRETRLYGLQVWMALPTAYEESAPSFQHYPANQIPIVEGEGWRASIVAGRAWEKTSPVTVFSPTLYADVEASAGATLTIDAEHQQRAVYVLEGSVEVGGKTFDAGRMLVLRPALSVSVRTPAGARLILIGGEPLDGPRHKFWNFVSSRRARIDAAKRDWREGRFPKVPGDEDDFIPLP
ncbi:MAG: pirin family protein [Marivibrio sp.]|uniref:pirin family protein n=1 Tax=Marivibrio sp. TaxID=2039719 RepID=UPI0032EB2B70